MAGRTGLRYEGVAVVAAAMGLVLDEDLLDKIAVCEMKVLAYDYETAKLREAAKK